MASVSRRWQSRRSLSCSRTPRCSTERFHPTRGACASISPAAWKRYGDRLDRFLVFGSRARGDASEESDIDILVLLVASPEDEAREITAAWELAGEAMKSTHTRAPLSLLVLSTASFAELKRRERRFALDVEAGGIAL